LICDFNSSPRGNVRDGAGAANEKNRPNSSRKSKESLSPAARGSDSQYSGERSGKTRRTPRNLRSCRGGQGRKMEKNRIQIRNFGCFEEKILNGALGGRGDIKKPAAVVAAGTRISLPVKETPAGVFLSPISCWGSLGPGSFAMFLIPRIEKRSWAPPKWAAEPRQLRPTLSPRKESK